MNPQDRVSLNGMLVFPFSSVETLIEYTDRHNGILVAVNAEKVAKANEETCKIVNDNIGYADGAGVMVAMRHKGHPDEGLLPEFRRFPAFPLPGLLKCG